MNFKIKNIGMVKEADINIDGITVIAGENDTGKSTIGKSLFCLIDGLNNIDKRINDARLELIQTAFYARPYRVTRLLRSSESEQVALNIISRAKYYINNLDALRDNVKKLISSESPDYIRHRSENDKNENEKIINDITEKIANVLGIPDKDVYVRALNEQLRSEFSGQITNIYSRDNGIIELNTQGLHFAVTIKDDNVINANDAMDFQRGIVYIDGSYPVDLLLGERYYLSGALPHILSLRDKLADMVSDNVEKAFAEVLISEKIDKILKLLNPFCGGELTPSAPYSYAYKPNNSTRSFKIANVSAGLKSFILIKAILMNRQLNDGDVLILDEPEIHLHPKWQLVFAELVVLLHKEFNLHILINTHSPYYLRAIEVYSRKHSVSGNCKYYLARKTKNISVTEDVTKSIDKLYDLLASPFQNLEDEAFTDE